MEEKKQINIDEIKRLLEASELENKKEIERKNDIPKILSQIRKGIIAFTILHLLFEICVSIFSKNFNYLGASVIVNYSFSNWYVKRNLNKNKISNQLNYFNYGVKISLIIFLIRVLLGVILFMIFFKIYN